jgi:hypothetical protein
MLRTLHFIENLLRDGGVLVSLPLRPLSTPQKMFLALISVRGWLVPQGHECRLRDYVNWKKFNDLVRTRTRDLRFSAYCLNQLRYRMAQINNNNCNRSISVQFPHIIEDNKIAMILVDYKTPPRIIPEPIFTKFLPCYTRHAYNVCLQCIRKLMRSKNM